MLKAKIKKKNRLKKWQKSPTRGNLGNLPYSQLGSWDWITL
jgi:hypothetical protein